jgi:hypothetical protein
MTARLEQDIRPVITHLQSAAVDASRSAAMAAAQVERADRLLTDATDRLERIFATVQSTATQIHQTVSGAGRMSGAWLAGIKAVMSAYRELRETPRKRRPAPVDEEDSLFIG